MGPMMDWYNQQFGSTNASAGLIGNAIGGGLGNYGLAQQQGMQNQQAYYNLYSTATYIPGTVSGLDFQAIQQADEKMSHPVKKVIRKTGKILEDLRREIDDWHGDILCRAA